MGRCAHTYTAIMLNTGFRPPLAGHEPRTVAREAFFFSRVKKCNLHLKKKWTTSAVVPEKCDTQPTLADAVRLSSKMLSTILVYTSPHAIFCTV